QRKEAGNLQNIVSTLVQDRDRLRAEKAELDQKTGEAQAAKMAAEEERQRADTEANEAEQRLHALEARYEEEKERVDQIVQDIGDKEVRQQLLMREVTALTETRTAWQNELLNLEAERREQEDLRRELEELQRARAQQEQRVDDLQSKANDLQH